MTDTDDKREDQGSDRPQPDEEERPQLREVSEDELKRILAAHEKWLESDGKEGEKANLARTNLIRANLQEANLFGANLQGAYLIDANLQEAYLVEAKLQGAYLYRANLQGATLWNADLQGADLNGAKFEGDEYSNLGAADLTGADLRNAVLADAELSDVKGLLAGKLAGTNLSNAKLPEDIAKFDGLTNVEEISRNARKIFLAMLLGCAYAWLTVATTTDARLLTNSASSPLPIIGTEIPIAWFYWAAPFILVGLYVYLHFYLERLWQGLAGLPARFPDGKRLDERAYPWLLNGLVRRHFTLLKAGRPPIARFEEWVTILLAWWVVPLTLGLFWLRYLPRHEWLGTRLHIGLLVVSVAAAIVFYRLTARTLRGDEPQPFRWKTPWRDRRAYQIAGIVATGVVLSVLSHGAIEGVRNFNPISGLRTDPDFTDVRRWVPWAFERLGFSTFANFVEEDVSTKPANYWQLSAEDRNKSVKGASLRGRDLRYADASRAFLANADLRRANLQGADLRGANLQGANLYSANLQEANLWRALLTRAALFEANLQGADLFFANLQEANLGSAKLQGADLEDAKLQGADLEGANLQGSKLIRANLNEARLFFANLQGARLIRANLKEARLFFANLEGADFTDAKGLTPKQLDEACGNPETTLPDYLSDYKMKPCPESGK